mmetsp:Transcript_14854/g.44882  ORF Transcript_14854/g.44882 Transcript_14854/m.44882 type:complete len:214 (-) Transcript_14854:198-839(-)
MRRQLLMSLTSTNKSPDGAAAVSHVARLMESSCCDNGAVATLDAGKIFPPMVVLPVSPASMPDGSAEALASAAAALWRVLLSAAVELEAGSSTGAEVASDDSGAAMGAGAPSDCTTGLGAVSLLCVTTTVRATIVLLYIVLLTCHTEGQLSMVITGDKLTLSCNKPRLPHVNPIEYSLHVSFYTFEWQEHCVACAPFCKTPQSPEHNRFGSDS